MMLSKLGRAVICAATIGVAAAGAGHKLWDISSSQCMAAIQGSKAISVETRSGWFCDDDQKISDFELRSDRTLRNIKHNMCVQAGEWMHLKRCDRNKPEQRWRMAVGDGVSMLMSDAGGCLARDLSNNWRVHIGPCASEPYTFFTRQHLAFLGEVVVTSLLDPSKCLEKRLRYVASWRPCDQANLNQYWRYDAVRGRLKPYGESDKCLKASGTEAWVGSCETAEWKYHADSEGLRNTANNKCLAYDPDHSEPRMVLCGSSEGAVIKLQTAHFGVIVDETLPQPILDWRWHEPARGVWTGMDLIGSLFFHDKCLTINDWRVTLGPCDSAYRFEFVYQKGEYMALRHRRWCVREDLGLSDCRDPLLFKPHANNILETAAGDCVTADATASGLALQRCGSVTSNTGLRQGFVIHYIPGLWAPLPETAVCPSTSQKGLKVSKSVSAGQLTKAECLARCIRERSCAFARFSGGLCRLAVNDHRLELWNKNRVKKFCDDNDGVTLAQRFTLDVGVGDNYIAAGKMAWNDLDGYLSEMVHIASTNAKPTMVDRRTVTSVSNMDDIPIGRSRTGWWPATCCECSNLYAPGGLGTTLWMDHFWGYEQLLKTDVTGTTKESALRDIGNPGTVMSRIFVPAFVAAVHHRKGDKPAAGRDLSLRVRNNGCTTCTKICGFLDPKCCEWSETPRRVEKNLNLDSAAVHPLIPSYYVVTLQENVVEDNVWSLDDSSLIVSLTIDEDSRERAGAKDPKNTKVTGGMLCSSERGASSLGEDASGVAIMAVTQGLAGVKFGGLLLGLNVVGWVVAIAGLTLSLACVTKPKKDGSGPELLAPPMTPCEWCGLPQVGPMPRSELYCQRTCYNVSTWWQDAPHFLEALNEDCTLVGDEPVELFMARVPAATAERVRSSIFVLCGDACAPNSTAEVEPFEGRCDLSPLLEPTAALAPEEAGEADGDGNGVSVAVTAGVVGATAVALAALLAAIVVHRRRRHAATSGASTHELSSKSQRETENPAFRP